MPYVFLKPCKGDNILNVAHFSTKSGVYIIDKIHATYEIYAFFDREIILKYHFFKIEKS